MGWQDDLLDASFRGITFDVISTDDAASQPVPAHIIPNTNGGSIQPMGFDPQNITIEAIFFGDDYLKRLKAFTVALRTQGTGILVHPVYGELTVAVNNYKIQHNAEAIDTATVSIVFIEDGITVDLFTQPTFDAPIDQLDAAAEATLAAANVVLMSHIQTLTSQAGKKLTPARKLRAASLGSKMLSRLQALRTAIKSQITLVTNAINAPLAWAEQMANLCNNLIDLRDLDIDVMRARLHDAKLKLASILRLPNDGKRYNTDQRTDQRMLQRHLNVMAFRTYAIAANTVFRADADQATLTPLDIEAIANSLRTDAQQLIDDYRSDAINANEMAVIEALKSTAYATQIVAQQLLERKPPLLQRTVLVAAPLRVIAHLWYQDHERATELMRLNPAIKNPTFIRTGEVLNAYAS